MKYVVSYFLIKEFLDFFPDVFADLGISVPHIFVEDELVDVPVVGCVCLFCWEVEEEPFGLTEQFLRVCDLAVREFSFPPLDEHRNHTFPVIFAEVLGFVGDFEFQLTAVESFLDLDPSLKPDISSTI